MSTIITAFVAAVIPSLFCGLVLGYMNRKADRRYEEDQEAAREKAEAAQVEMQLIASAGALSYAVAVAIKRGSANGEVENAVTEYALARKRFNDYLVETAAKENVK